MNTTRIISTAAFSILASFGAQASTGVGETSGFTMTPDITSSLSRAEVQRAGSASLPAQKNNMTFEASTASSSVSRTDVQAQAVSAIQDGDLATGQRS